MLENDLQQTIILNSALVTQKLHVDILVILQPDRTYYLDDPTGNSHEWVDIINEWIDRAKST